MAKPATPENVPDVGLCRVLLFTPGNRPDRFAKAAATGADGLILDLEDAVSAAGKDEARATLIEHFRAGHRRDLAPGQVGGLRVNNIHTAAGVRDLDALVTSGVAPDFVLLPKVESAVEVRLYARHLPAIPLVCTIESARGLDAASDIANAAPQVRAIAFGGVDLAADLRAELAWEPLLWGRSRLAQAAATAGIAAIDVPHVVIDDEAGLRSDALRVKAMGYTAKLAIHPKQVPPILEVFTPTAAEIERARGIVAACEAAGGNVVEYQGKMVDEPVVKAAQQLLARGGHRR
jgi:(S)-citramalyl-CoA lyase